MEDMRNNFLLVNYIRIYRVMHRAARLCLMPERRRLMASIITVIIIMKHNKIEKV